MEIKKIKFASSFRYLGFKSCQGVMGYAGEVLIYLKNESSFPGGYVEIEQFYSFTTGFGHGTSSGEVATIEVPSFNTTYKMRVPIPKLPWQPGIINPMDLTIRVSNKQKESLTSSLFPCFLVDEERAKEIIRDNILLILSFLTLVFVIISLIF